MITTDKPNPIPFVASLSITLLFVVSALLSGCVVATEHRVPGTHFPEAQPESVQLFYEQPARAFTVIGFVSVGKGIGVPDSAVEAEFRKGAARIGGNAVIIEVLPSAGAVNPVQGHGKVVRWTQ